MLEIIVIARSRATKHPSLNENWIASLALAMTTDCPGCVSERALLQRFDLHDRSAVVVADPEADRRGGIVDKDAPDIGAARQQIVDRLTGRRIEPRHLIAQHRAGPGLAMAVDDDVIRRRPPRRDQPLLELFLPGVEHANAIGAIFAEP